MLHHVIDFAGRENLGQTAFHFPGRSYLSQVLQVKSCYMLALELQKSLA